MTLAPVILAMRDKPVIVAADTQRMNDFITERVREQPAQYYWLHKRFKTRPEGEPSVYG